MPLLRELFGPLLDPLVGLCNHIGYQIDLFLQVVVRLGSVLARRRPIA
jgi:hypothetical protein